MKKYILIIFTFFISILNAQNKNDNGYSFLKIGNSARNLSLADFGIIGNSDVSSVYYNPAALSKLNEPQIFVSHNSWIQDLSSQNIAGNASIYGIPIAVQLNNTVIKDIEIRTNPGELLSRFDARYFSVSFSSAARLYGNLFGGFSLKYLFENILSDESSGYAIDFGFLFTDVISEFDIGLSIRNIGSVSRLRTKVSDLPADIRIGGSYKLDFEKISSSVNLIAGAQKYIGENDSHLHFAAEYIYDELVFIRAGFISGYESRNLSYGIGLSWASARLDYAYLPFGYNLGSSNTISLLYNF